MSKIIRSLDQAQPRVTEVDLRAHPMGPQRVERPEGGFAGVALGMPMPQIMTDIERREMEAIQTLEAAKREAETIQRDAWHAGFEQGERAGEKLAQQKIDPVMASFRELIEAVQVERATLIEVHERELIKVAFAIAMQVLKTALDEQPELVINTVNAALAKIPSRHRVVVRVSPHDRLLIEQQMGKSDGPAWPPELLDLQDDATIARGGCSIQTETGEIDATIETQLRTIKGELWGE